MSQPARYPGYLPYPTAIGRAKGPYSVPNESSVNWPQAQFAPPYLAPGSPSVQPYRYEPGGPLVNYQPSMYSSETSDLGSPDLEDLGSPDSETMTVWRAAMLLAPALAMAVSYSRNKSIPWAVASGVVSLPYLTYVAYEKITEKK